MRRITSLLTWLCVVAGSSISMGVAENDFFGSSVALSSDGNTAIIGADCADVGGITNQGAGYVFTRGGSGWTQQAKLTASDGAAWDRFGASVALSSDGNTAIAGAYLADVDGNDGQGAAYVFTWSGASWNQQAKLIATGGDATDFFGSSVALSSDGDTAIIGASCADVDGNIYQGAAYVFTRSGVSWTQQAKLTATNGAAKDMFGNSVALSSDGNTAIAGAYKADVGGNADQGAAYMFTRSGASWNQQAKLTATNGAEADFFGSRVALSSDGDTAIAGASCADGGNVNHGAAYVFARSGASWTQQVKLTASDGAGNDYFGISVTLNSDGNTAIAGAYQADVGGNAQQGAGYVFARSGASWTQQAKLTATDGAASDRFGISVTLNSDGNTAIAGAYQADVGGNIGQGAAYAFTRSGGAWSQQAKLTATNGIEPVIKVGPAIKANGVTNNVTVNYPDPVSITVEMNADIYAGAEVDWWVVAFAHSGAWYYLNSAMQWTLFSGDLASCRPVYQGALFNLSSTPILSALVLPRGIYDFWFAVDYPMDGILNPDGQILSDKVTIGVQ